MSVLNVKYAIELPYEEQSNLTIIERISYFIYFGLLFYFIYYRSKSVKILQVIFSLSLFSPSTIQSYIRQCIKKMYSSKTIVHLCFSVIQRPYFAGLKQCDDGGIEVHREDLICGACSGNANKCPKHGDEYMYQTSYLFICLFVTIFAF